MKKKVLGVVGGLGPLATARFLELTTAMTDARKEQEHLDMIIYNYPSIPDRTGYILGSNLRSPLPGLMNAAQALSRQKVCCIAIPCVTAHYFLTDLEERISTPILSGVRETAEYLKQQGVGSAGILATDGTLRARLFHRELEKMRIRPVEPDSADQAALMHLIYDHIKAGKPADFSRFQEISRNLRGKGAEVLILGCTELSLIKRDHPLEGGYLDTMEVLARQSIDHCGKKRKPEYGNLIT